MHVYNYADQSIIVLCPQLFLAKNFDYYIVGMHNHTSRLIVP